MYLLIFATIPKEKCPKCGKDIYPLEFGDNKIYRECTKCGFKEVETLPMNSDE